MKNEKTKTSILAPFFMGLPLIAASAIVDARTLTLGAVDSSQNISIKAMQKWGELLAEETNGRWGINVIPGGVLGGDRELSQQLAAGEIDLYLNSPVVLQYLAPEYKCLEAEYIFENEDHGFNMWYGDLGREVTGALKESYGVEIIEIAKRGARHVISNRAIEEPNDIEGLKMRVTNDLRSQAFSALGAQPAPLPLSELYGALRQGVFDAAEAPINTIHQMRLYEAQPYISKTGHIWSYLLVMANENILKELGSDREAFMATLKTSVEWLNSETSITEESALEEMKNQGVAVNDVNTDAFKEIVSPIVKQYYEKNCKTGLFEQVQAYAAD